MTEETNNAVSVFGGSVNVADMKSLAQKAKVAALNSTRSGGPGGSDFMNFSGKRGVFTVGKEERKVQSDEQWVVDVTSFEEGWICWKGGKPAGTRLANIYTGVPIPQPAPDELGPFNEQKGEGWFAAKSLVMKSLDNDQQAYFKINSVSGVSSMADLIGEFSDRANAGMPCWPIICLDIEEFEAQGFKNFKPVFAVQEWMTAEQLQDLVNGEGGDEEEEPEVAPAKEEPKPAGRRRPRG